MATTASNSQCISRSTNQQSRFMALSSPAPRPTGTAAGQNFPCGAEKDFLIHQMIMMTVCVDSSRLEVVWVLTGCLAPSLHSLYEPCELSQWLCHTDSTINIVVGIIIIITIFYGLLAQNSRLAYVVKQLACTQCWMLPGGQPHSTFEGQWSYQNRNMTSLGSSVTTVIRRPDLLN